MRIAGKGKSRIRSCKKYTPMDIIESVQHVIIYPVVKFTISCSVFIDLKTQPLCKPVPFQHATGADWVGALPGYRRKTMSVLGRRRASPVRPARDGRDPEFHQRMGAETGSSTQYIVRCFIRSPRRQVDPCVVSSSDARRPRVRQPLQTLLHRTAAFLLMIIRHI